MIKLLNPSVLVLLALPGVVTGHGHHHDHHHHHEERKLQRRGGPTTPAASPKYEDYAFQFNGENFSGSKEFVEANMRCRTRDLSAERQSEVETFVQKQTKDKITRLRQLQNQEIVVNTYFHIVYQNGPDDPSNVSMEVIEKQLKIMNEAYAGVTAEYKNCFGEETSGLATPFRFCLKAVNRVLDNNWHNGIYDDEMRRQLRVGTCSDLNIFISNARGNLGFATLASWCDNTDIYEDLVNINWQTLPGVGTGRFSQGDTMVHEVGHWLGLEHTFQGGCFGYGDGVSDTAPERSAGYGCVIGRDTCVGGGPDPIHNFMDYSDDCCMHTFSEGQKSRMVQHVMAYRNLEYTPMESPGGPTPSPVPDIEKDSGGPPGAAPRTCPEGEMQVDVMMTFDEWPDETSWDIIQVDNQAKLATFQGLTNQKFSQITQTTCLNAQQQTKQYIFVIRDKYGDGMGATGNYNIQINSKPVAGGGAFEYVDTFTFGTPMACSEKERPFLVVMQTDRYASENWWVLRGRNASLIGRGGFDGEYDDATLYLRPFCIPRTTNLRFALRDTEGDGICCKDGPGYWAIYMDNDKIKDGGRFGAAVGRTFNSN